jgi:hypothetical protein
VTSEIPISFGFGVPEGTVIIPKMTILAGMKPFIGFQSAVTVVLDANTKAWNPDGGYFKGPDTVSYIHNTKTGVVKARVGIELFE